MDFMKQKKMNDGYKEAGNVGMASPPRSLVIGIGHGTTLVSELNRFQMPFKCSQSHDSVMDHFISYKIYPRQELVELCFQRRVSKLFGGVIALPYGVRQIIHEYSFEKIDQLNIHEAVRLWIAEDRAMAEMRYGHISDWDVSGVVNMDDLFEGYAKFNDDISRWDVRNVTSMASMFRQCEEFNANISGWDVSQVRNMDQLFDRAASFDQPLKRWDVSRVTNMHQLFRGAYSFNQSLSTWRVGQVTDMSEMFNNASLFNQPLATWDVSQVIIMRGMFDGASAYNQPLPIWNENKAINLS